MIIFASYAVADEWWRVSTSSIVGFSDSVRHVSAQFYTHDMGQASAVDLLTMNGVAIQLLVQVFFCVAGRPSGRNLSTIPSSDCANNISGNPYPGTVPYCLTATRQTQSMFGAPNALASVLVSLTRALQGPS